MPRNIDEIAEKIEARLAEIEKRMENERIDAIVYRTGIQSDVANLTSKLSVVQELTDDYREQRDLARGAAKVLSIVRAFGVFVATIVGAIAAYFGIIKQG